MLNMFKNLNIDDTEVIYCVSLNDNCHVYILKNDLFYLDYDNKEVKVFKTESSVHHTGWPQLDVTRLGRLTE